MITLRFCRVRRPSRPFLLLEMMMPWLFSPHVPAFSLFPFPASNRFRSKLQNLRHEDEMEDDESDLEAEEGSGVGGSSAGGSSQKQVLCEVADRGPASRVVSKQHPPLVARRLPLS